MLISGWESWWGDAGSGIRCCEGAWTSTARQILPLSQTLEHAHTPMPEPTPSTFMVYAATNTLSGKALRTTPRNASTGLPAEGEEGEVWVEICRGRGEKNEVWIT